MNPHRLLISSLAAASLLAACGGGSSTEPAVVVPPVINTPPPSASANIAGLVAFTAAQAALSADTAEVVVLDDYVLPSDAMDSAVAVSTPNDA